MREKKEAQEGEGAGQEGHVGRCKRLSLQLAKEIWYLQQL